MEDLYRLMDIETGLYLEYMSSHYRHLEFSFSGKGRKDYFHSFKEYISEFIGMKLVNILDCQFGANELEGPLPERHSRELKEFLGREVVLVNSKDKTFRIDLKSLAKAEIDRIVSANLTVNEIENHTSPEFRHILISDYFSGNYSPEKTYYILEGEEGVVPTADELVMLKLSSETDIAIIDAEIIIEKWKQLIPDYLLND